MRSVFDSPAYCPLSSHACKLLLELVGQFQGDNNGDLTVAWALMCKPGWRSRSILWRCKAELIEAGFIDITHKGHMPITCELLALTWFALGVAKKFDREALACFNAKAYRMNAHAGNFQSKSNKLLEADLGQRLDIGAAQAALIRGWRPWAQSTGPKTPEGKAASENETQLI